MKQIGRSNVFLALCYIAVIAQAGAASPNVSNPNLIAESNASRHATPEVVARNQQHEAEYQEGNANLQAKNYALAEEDFQAALALEHDGASYLGLAESLVGQGRTAEALQAYYMLFHPGPKESWGGSYVPRAQLEYALLLNENGRWLEAVTMYEKALPNISDRGMAKINIHFDPAVPQSVGLEAAAHIGIGLEDNWAGGNLGNTKDEQAFVEYTKALQLAPDWDVANYYYGYGWQHLDPKDRAKMGSCQQATAALQKAVKIGNTAVKKAAAKALKDAG